MHIDHFLGEGDAVQQIIEAENAASRGPSPAEFVQSSVDALHRTAQQIPGEASDFWSKHGKTVFLIAAGLVGFYLLLPRAPAYGEPLLWDDEDDFAEPLPPVKKTRKRKHRRPIQKSTMESASRVLGARRGDRDDYYRGVISRPYKAIR